MVTGKCHWHLRTLSGLDSHPVGAAPSGLSPSRPLPVPLPPDTAPSEAEPKPSLPRTQPGSCMAPAL